MRQQLPHEDHLLTWESMAQDPLLAASNPKGQVPTLIDGDQANYDALLIALDHLPAGWHGSLDAKLFRLGDCDLEAAIIFLFRARLLADSFGASEHSALMEEAGIAGYEKSINYLLDHLLADSALESCGFGAVLVQSTLLACQMLGPKAIEAYRREELAAFAQVVEADRSYRDLAGQYRNNPDCRLPFFLTA